MHELNKIAEFPVIYGVVNVRFNHVVYCLEV